MWYSYWLMNKAVLANGLVEENQVTNPNRESRQRQRDAEGVTFIIVSHSLVEIHRLIEMG